MYRVSLFSVNTNEQSSCSQELHLNLPIVLQHTYNTPTYNTHQAKDLFY